MAYILQKPENVHAGDIPPPTEFLPLKWQDVKVGDVVKVPTYTQYRVISFN